jgi:hypothetical protein
VNFVSFVVTLNGSAAKVSFAVSSPFRSFGTLHVCVQAKPQPHTMSPA